MAQQDGVRRAASERLNDKVERRRESRWTDQTRELEVRVLPSDHGAFANPARADNGPKPDDVRSGADARDGRGVDHVMVVLMPQKTPSTTTAFPETASDSRIGTANGVTVPTYCVASSGFAASSMANAAQVKTATFCSCDAGHVTAGRTRVFVAVQPKKSVPLQKSVAEPLPMTLARGPTVSGCLLVRMSRTGRVPMGFALQRHADAQLQRCIADDDVLMTISQGSFSPNAGVWPSPNAS